jgi:hypothetical protein
MKKQMSYDDLLRNMGFRITGDRAAAASSTHMQPIAEEAPAPPPPPAPVKFTAEQVRKARIAHLLAVLRQRQRKPRGTAMPNAPRARPNPGNKFVFM